MRRLRLTAFVQRWLTSSHPRSFSTLLARVAAPQEESDEKTKVRAELKVKIKRAVNAIELEWCKYKGQRWLDFAVTFVNGVAHKASMDLKTGELTGLAGDMD